MKCPMMEVVGPGKQLLRENIGLYAAGVIVVLVLKHFYSGAGVEDLVWILQPLAILVEIFTGIQFQYDATSGYVSLASRVVIAPACAGVNFLIICFATLFFTLVSRIGTPVKKWGWLVISIAAAYLATLWINSVRIIVSIYLYRADFYGELVTPERVHRLAGTLLYVPALVAIYVVAERIVNAYSGRGAVPAVSAVPEGAHRLRMVVPLAWYLAITLMVPLLNGAIGRHGVAYLEHALQVLMAITLISFIWRLTGAVKNSIDLCGETKENRARQASTIAES